MTYVKIVSVRPSVITPPLYERTPVQVEVEYDAKGLNMPKISVGTYGAYANVLPGGGGIPVSGSGRRTVTIYITNHGGWTAREVTLGIRATLTQYVPKKGDQAVATDTTTIKVLNPHYYPISNISLSVKYPYVTVSSKRTIDHVTYDIRGPITRTGLMEPIGSTSGRFKLPPLEPGTYTIEVRAWDRKGQLLGVNRASFAVSAVKPPSPPKPKPEPKPKPQPQPQPQPQPPQAPQESQILVVQPSRPSYLPLVLIGLAAVALYMWSRR